MNNFTRLCYLARIILFYRQDFSKGNLEQKKFRSFDFALLFRSFISFF